MFLCLLETSLLLDPRCTSLHFWSVCRGSSFWRPMVLQRKDGAVGLMSWGEMDSAPVRK